MNLRECVLVALEGLAVNRMRAALTVLGLVIGVAAVIVMMALGRGARDRVMQDIKKMGTNVLFVGPARSRSGAMPSDVGSLQILTLADVEAVEQCPSVNAVAPEIMTKAQVKGQDQNVNTTVLGTTPEFLAIRNYEVSSGRMFTAEEVHTYRRVAVIGPTTAAELFGDDTPIGETLRIKGSQFRIIGLMKEKGAQGTASDPDDQVTIPITTLMRRLIGTRYVQSLSVQALSMESMEGTTDEVYGVLDERHPPPPGADSRLDIKSQSEMMTLAEETSRVFTLLLAGIASVSLVVGGIGIMNVMLVSVTERTREIGIRKAIGALRRDIQKQFIIEALVLSLCGGLCGVLLGILAVLIMKHLAGMHATVTLGSLAISFTFAALVGIFFGYYPAQQASRLDPIEALRFE